MIQEIAMIDRIQGELVLPGDKSISHRAIMFSSMAEGESIVRNYLDSADVNSTIDCFKKLGCQIDKIGPDLLIKGRGYKGFSEPSEKLNAGNSGTTTRLISGILAAQNFETEIIGDRSLSKRPMKRVVDPLTKMGAKIKTSEKETLPMEIFPSNDLHSIVYEMDIASAQIKSALLLAGLHLKNETIVIEHAKTRNHTETLLDLKIEEFDNSRKIFVSRKDYPKPQEYIVPSDISTAAFFIILALVNPNSELKLKNVLLNETRVGVLQVLELMDANIIVKNESMINGERIGDLSISTSSLSNVNISNEIIPNIIDEIPILSIAGIFADGHFIIRNAKELRYKESDRISSMCSNFKNLGLECNEFEDGFEVWGEVKNTNVLIESYDDHRIAMAFAVLGLLVEKKIKINDFECVAVSNPEFLNQIKSIT